MDRLEERLLPLPKFITITERQYWNFLCNIDRINKTEDECWNWKKYKDPKTGYGVVRLLGQCYKAHRIAYFFHHKVDPGNQRVLHTCDNPACCNPKHLFLGDQSTNMIQRHENGRYNNHGELNPHSVLSNNQVKMIRNSILTNAELARKLGVDWGTVKNAREYKTYKDVE